MSNNFYTISKIEIKSLWQKFDLDWTLDPDVNVLSGANGSGKSTILDCVASLISVGSLPKEYQDLVDSIKIIFTNGKIIHFEHIKDTIKNLERKAVNSPKFKSIISELKKNEGSDYKKIKSVSFGLVTFGSDKNNFLEELHKQIDVDIVSTFDNQILELGRPEETVKTELDRDIFRLQKKYLDFQLNIGKKAFEIVSRGGNNSQEEVLKIKSQQDEFLKIIDTLFAETGKKINREKNEITFTIGKDELTPYQLSSGEKQILVILLTVLVQDNKPSIIFMDEPEISLHFDWQKELIKFIIKLNPNAQIILTTHSPAMIMDGWMDKVSNVSDLIINDK